MTLSLFEVEQMLKTNKYLGLNERIREMRVTTSISTGKPELEISLVDHKKVQGDFISAVKAGNKIVAIKALRDAKPGLGLIEAKEVIEAIWPLFTQQ